MQEIEIYTSDNISLVTLNCNLLRAANVLCTLADKGISVDMISQNPPVCGKFPFSFTVDDEYIGKAIITISALSENGGMMKPLICTGNTKITVKSEEMRSNPGYASAIFKKFAEADIDIRLITTSEIDISMLMPGSEKDKATEILKNICGKQ